MNTRITLTLKEIQAAYDALLTATVNANRIQEQLITLENEIDKIELSMIGKSYEEKKAAKKTILHEQRATEVKKRELAFILSKAENEVGRIKYLLLFVQKEETQ